MMVLYGLSREICGRIIPLYGGECHDQRNGRYHAKTAGGVIRLKHGEASSEPYFRSPRRPIQARFNAALVNGIVNSGKSIT